MYDVLCDPPVRPAAREGSWTWSTCVRRDHRSCGGRTATPRPGSRWQFASSVRLVDALLPRMLEEEAGRQPIREVGPQLGLPSPSAQMMNILEAEGRGRPQPGSLLSSTRLVVILVDDHRLEVVTGLRDENP